MKAILKRTLVTVLICLLLASLCSCAALDEMRQKQAFLQENGDISLNGTVYKPLPENPFFSPQVGETDDQTVYLTKPDLPVLLSSISWEQMLYTDKDRVLLGADYSDIWYCRQDRYAEYEEKLRQSFTPTQICYLRYDFMTDAEQTVALSPAQADAVRGALTTEPIVLDDGFELNREWSLALQEASQDLLMQRDFGELVFTGAQYYLLSAEDNVITYYRIPEANEHLFSAIEPY